MAVSIDIDALRDVAGSVVWAAADELRSSGQPAEFVPVGGGASGVFRDAGKPPVEVWVGATMDGYKAECDCSAGTSLCAHAVALTLAALNGGLAWSSAATPPSAVAVDPEVAHLAEIARSIPVRRLALLVAEWAAKDRVLEGGLRAQAGQLAALTDNDLDRIRRTIDSLAGEATSGHGWDLHDVEKAGRTIVEEVEVLAQRPPTEEMLLLVERAARAWDGLSGYLYDAWETYEEEPAEIEQVQPDPDELATLLAEIITAAEVDSCLDEPWDYLAVLGRQRVKALLRRR